MGDVGRLGAAGIGAAADVATNAATNATNAVIANKTNQTSKDIAAANNEMQERLNTTNNQFSASEAEKAYQRQVEQWHREVQYNSPIEQLQRFQEAGLNPSVAFGGNLGSSSSASASSAPMATPHGSGVSPSMPTLIPAHMEDPKVGSAFADIFKALNEGKKQGAEATQINQTMTTLLESLKADVESKNLANALTKAYGDAKASAEIENIVQNTSTSTKLAYVYATQGDLNKAEQALADARKETEKATAALRGEEKKLMEKRNEVFYKQVEADLKTAASQQAANYGAAASGYASADASRASADKMREETYQLKELLPYVRDQHQVQVYLMRKDLQIKGVELLQNEKLVDKIAEETLQIIEQTNGIKMSNYIRDAAKEDIIKSIYYNAAQQRQNFHNPFQYIGGLMSGAAPALINSGNY